MHVFGNLATPLLSALAVLELVKNRKLARAATKEMWSIVMKTTSGAVNCGACRFIPAILPKVSSLI